MWDAFAMQWLEGQASFIHMLSKVTQGSLCKQAGARTTGIGMVSLCCLPMPEPKGMADAVSTSEGEWNNGRYQSEKGSCTCPGTAVFLPIAAFHPVAGGEVSVPLSLCSLFRICLSPILNLWQKMLDQEKARTLLLGMTKFSVSFVVVSPHDKEARNQNVNFTLWHLYQAHTSRNITTKSAQQGLPCWLRVNPRAWRCVSWSDPWHCLPERFCEGNTAWQKIDGTALPKATAQSGVCSLSLPKKWHG